MTPGPSIIKGKHHGHTEYRLRWTEVHPGPKGGLQIKVKQSHWFADVDEAMAVQFAMKAGMTFEEARQEVLYIVGLDPRPTSPKDSLA